MIDFIPVKDFYHLFLNFCLFVLAIILLHTYRLPMNDDKNLSFFNRGGYLFLIIILLYIGLRPVSYLFGDMIIYARHFDRFASGAKMVVDKDIVFYSLMKLSSKIMTKEGFFFMCATLYIIPLYRISKKLFGIYWFYSFFVLVGSFQFWPYAVNGIRNGIATSFFLLAVSYYNNRVLMIVLLYIATLFHQTLLLPVLAFIATFFYNKPKTYMIAWIMAIPLSITLGGFWEVLFAKLGFTDDRLSSYLLGAGDSLPVGTGFRWDFLIYSSAPIIIGWYFIFKRNFSDKLYIQLFNTYTIANAFWILVIRASFSNRFAYLSWFLMGILIIYPYLKEKFYANQNEVIGKVIFVYFAFTYLMYYLFYGVISPSSTQ